MIKNEYGFAQLRDTNDAPSYLVNIGGGGFYTTQSAATCTLAMVTSAVTVSGHSLRYGDVRIEGSLSDTPAAAVALTLQSYAGTPVWGVDLNAKGPFSFALDDALLSIGTGYVATLGSGAGSVVGKLNIRYKIKEGGG